MRGNDFITKDITTLRNHLIAIIENSPPSNHILLIFIEKQAKYDYNYFIKSRR